MNEHQIMFANDMLKLVMEGKKTQTRRIVKPQPIIEPDGRMHWKDVGYSTRHERVISYMLDNCPYGKPGDALWVKENIHLVCNEPGWPAISVYDDGTLTVADAWPWKTQTLSKLFCPRGLSRTMLEIVSIRVELLHEISYDDCCHETGAPLTWPGLGPEPYKRDACSAVFIAVWDALNLKRGHGWHTNPWVWVIDFELLENIE